MSFCCVLFEKLWILRRFNSVTTENTLKLMFRPTDFSFFAEVFCHLSNYVLCTLKVMESGIGVW